jgi:hypothetical protein
LSEEALSREIHEVEATNLEIDWLVERIVGKETIKENSFGYCLDPENSCLFVFVFVFSFER